MKEIKFVSEGSAATAREFERRFQLLPPQAGIIFISIKAVPEFKGLCDKFEIVLGLTRSQAIAQSTGMALIEKVLEREFSENIFTFTSRIELGISGSWYSGVEDLSLPPA